MQDNPYRSFLAGAEKPPKPRTRGITEIRGPYYTPVGPHYLEDLLAAVGERVDGLKFAGGAFAVMSRSSVRALVDVAHAHDVKVSTGGFIERVLALGADAVDAYLRDVRELGFDTVEVSAGFVSLDAEQWAALVRRVAEAGLEPRAEVGIQFGAGGDSPAAALAAEGTRGIDRLVALADRLLEAGSPLLMIESEGITENVTEWRLDAVEALAHRIGVERLVFEAADSRVFGWYVRTFGPSVNLFVDHSQVLQLEALRAGVWGDTRSWGRIVNYPPDDGTR